MRIQKRQILKIEEIIFRTISFLCTCLIAMLLVFLLVNIFRKGLPSLSWEMITETPKGGFYFGKEGGILNAILGSVYLAFGSVILSLIVGLPVALYMNVHMKKHKKLVNGMRLILDILWGVPSLVYGAVCFFIMIEIGIRASLLAGIISVSLFILPVLIRAMDEVLKTVPDGLLESSLSLGATKTKTAIKIFTRQCMPGLFTAVLLAFGRAIGDAAAVLFTTGFTDNIPTSPFQQVATLPLSIFFQLGSPYEEVKNRAYAASLILTIIVLIISVTSRILSRKYHKRTIKF